VDIGAAEEEIAEVLDPLL